MTGLYTLGYPRMTGLYTLGYLRMTTYPTITGTHMKHNITGYWGQTVCGQSGQPILQLQHDTWHTPVLVLQLEHDTLHTPVQAWAA